MSPAHSKKKNGRRYRYYVSQALVKGEPKAAETLSRVSAQVVEELVLGFLKNVRDDEEWDDLPPAEQLKKVRAHVRRVVVHSEELEITWTPESSRTQRTSTARIPLRIQKRGRETTITVHDGDTLLRPDRVLIKAISRACSWRDALASGDAKTFGDLVKTTGYSKRYIRRLLPLGFLAPDIVEAILHGSQPSRLKLADLLDRDLPLSWHMQRRKLGFFQKQSH